MTSAPAQPNPGQPAPAQSGRFDPATADLRWQKAWDDAQSFRADDTSTKPRSYVLEMFPYPSGRIHIGHVRNYTMGDVLARYKKMTGHEVLHPMGWDAFGMPAENAAMEKGVHPGGWTRENIANMKAQLKRLGFALDWSREIATCEPEYYGHEQALFLDLYAGGLVYRKESAVNWDPIDHTVLANEQVIDGRGWRSGALVEKRKLNQWFLKITDFADELLEGLSTLDKWPEKVRLMQENWIGKSQGLEFRFTLSNGVTLPVYTTRPDTIFGASFVAVAADHPVAQAAAAGNPAAQDFIALCKQGGTTAAELETAEKLGFDTGLTAAHPFTGAALPVYIANFVLMDYGTGAIMAVPGHDQRDFDFATKYGLPIHRVVAADAAQADAPFGTEAEAGDGILVNSQFLDGMSVAQAKAAVISRAQAEGWGEGKTVWRLRDWGVSRQRYWGTPIPSSIAKCAAWCRCPRSTCRSPCPKTSISRCRATRSTAIRRGSMSIARSAATPPAAKPIRSTPSSTARGTSCALPASPPTARSILNRSGSGCRSNSISAGSSTRSCTCSMPGSGPAPLPASARSM
jgi:leucyl-tRNA synthetase